MLPILVRTLDFLYVLGRPSRKSEKRNRSRNRADDETERRDENS